jgi:hypothetical protein
MAEPFLRAARRERHADKFGGASTSGVEKEASARQRHFKHVFVRPSQTGSSVSLVGGPHDNDISKICFNYQDGFPEATRSAGNNPICSKYQYNRLRLPEHV